MELLSSFLEHLSDFETLIKWGGLTVLILIIFAETGLLAGFLLPGDSLLVTAGLLASQGTPFPDIFSLNVSLIAAAIIGDTVGYYFGKKTGPKIFTKDNSRFFDKNHLLTARKFFEYYGGKAIIYARFLPIVRTFAPVVAGIAVMDFKRFMFFNITGGILWISSLTLLGYFFGSIEIIKNNFEYVIIAIIVLSTLPLFWGYFKLNKKTIL